MVFGVRQFVYQPPELFKDPTFTLSGFKGAIVVTAAISVVIYLTNLFVKLATSSFHLASDARERKQLTLAFLALQSSGAVDEKERAIVLSAIFARSDTGLFKYDSSPAAPNPTKPTAPSCGFVPYECISSTCCACSR